MNKSKKAIKKAPSPAADTVEGNSASPKLAVTNTCGQGNVNSVNMTTDTDVSQTLEGEDEPSPRAILLAIRKMDGSMTTRFNDLEASLSGVKSTLAANSSRIENTSLKSKVTDLEARSRRQNIKIAGLPENVEKGNPTQFVSGLLPSLLGEANFPRGVKVDRAHRIGPVVNNRPRVMIARIHHDTVKTEILRLARNQSPLSFESVSSRIFQQRCPPNGSSLTVHGRN
ncbi:unnamed protein product [Leuciscus chuanchicus]